MNNKSKVTKTAGKIFLIFISVILAAILVISWFLGGQTMAVEKYCSALASGDLKNFNAVTNGSSEISEEAKTAFKNARHSFFSSRPEFAELEDTDIISSDVDITLRKRTSDASINEWVCSADVDFFVSGMSISENIEIPMKFSHGKWIISDSAENYIH